MSELIACPFCGSTDLATESFGEKRHCVVCEKCECSTGYMLDDDEAIESWNTRPIEDGLRAELEFAKNDLATRLTELAAAQAEVERLRGIIREAEFSSDQQTSVDSFVAVCPICSAEYSWGHNDDCPFYQWEGGAQ